MELSVSLAIASISSTHSTGYFPVALSPESMMALVASKIAFEISLTSALVGLGLLIIDSSIWVAVITILPCK